MRPGVSAVEAWNPGSLRTTADLLDDIVERLDDRLKGLLSDQDVLAEQWTGPAASAAAARIVRERSLGSAVAGALSQTADAYRAGAGIADGARMHVLAMVRNADCQGFTVHDNGIVDASGQVERPTEVRRFRVGTVRIGGRGGDDRR